MITIRKLTYQLKEKPEQPFTRLKWAVEQVDTLLTSLLTNSTLDTNRPWVGVLCKERLSFSLIEPKSMISPNPLQLVVKGEVSNENKNTIVRLRIQLGPYPTIFLGLTFILIIALFTSTLVNLGTKEMLGATFTVLILFTLIAVLTNRALLKTETKLDQLFDE